MRNLGIALGLTIAMFTQPIAAQDTPSADQRPYPTIEQIISIADFHGGRISPSGKYFSGIRQGENFEVFMTLDLEDPDSSPVYVDLGDTFPVWTLWANDDRLIMRTRAYVQIKKRENVVLSREQLRDREFDEDYYAVNRLIAVDPDGSNAVLLFSDDAEFQHANFNASLVSVLPDEPDHVLMSTRLHGELDLFKINIQTGEHERIAFGTLRTIGWFTDRNGEPAFRLNTNRLYSEIDFYARQSTDEGKIKWHKVRTIRVDRENDQDESSSEFRPLAPGPTPSTYYVAARPENAETTSVYLYDLEAGEFLETVKSIPGYDVRGGFFDPATQEFLGVSYYADHLVLDFDDPATQANADGLQSYFGNKTNIFVVDQSEDQQVWLLRTTGPNDPGTYHVFELANAAVYPVANNMPVLQETRLADVSVVNYTARDGLPLTGYLTHAAGYAADEIAPLIVMPHGGPESRDTLGFNRTAQILAAKGYQVFQPNFRGSSGYGKTFAEKGYGRWGRYMQTDIEDGFDTLVERGLASPDKACIYGSSYGGYAAQVGLTLTPDLYQCVISFAGVSDLIRMLNWEARETGSFSRSYEYWKQQIGDPGKDRDAIRTVSPIENLENATAPLLLVHGTEDRVVPIEQSEKMYEAMTKAGKTVEFLELEDATHRWFEEGDEKLYYDTVLGFLAEHLPSIRNK